MDILTLEAKIQQLQLLESIHGDTIGDVPMPMACVHCYNLSTECQCSTDEQLIWPVEQVLYKLRMDVMLADTGAYVS